MSPSAQKCIDKFPPPLLLSVPRDNGLVARKTRRPLSPNLIIINSATLSHSPRGLSLYVEYHFVSDQVRGMTNVLLEFFANEDTSVALAMHSSSLSVVPHMMSLNIDMKIIRHWNCAGSPILFGLLDFVDELQCGIFHSNSTGFPSIVSKVLYCGESLNQFNCSSQTVFDAGF